MTRLDLLAVGRLRGGPEADLVADYAARATAAGRAIGLGPLAVQEIDERRARTAEAQAARLVEAAGAAHLVALDERGRALSSDALARHLAALRDRGTSRLAFAIGGAEGHGPALISRADETLSFGAMVWPHALARAMLAEQLYRAISILAGSPYHRG
ncbi:MAG: 23S rRNA (pseudouridine(1915)-N(3))-methyltransferase RlmH [Paracoccaceae bacterium]